MSQFVEPNTYRASGRVRWLVFLPGVALTLATAVFMAWCLHLLFEAGYYFLIVAPLIASFPVAGVLYAAVSLGHCRNRIVAGAVGVLAALVLSVGHFYFDLVEDFGWANAARIDALPHYINRRMQTD